MCVFLWSWRNKIKKCVETKRISFVGGQTGNDLFFLSDFLFSHAIISPCWPSEDLRFHTSPKSSHILHCRTDFLFILLFHVCLQISSPWTADVSIATYSRGTARKHNVSKATWILSNANPTSLTTKQWQNKQHSPQRSWHHEGDTLRN